MKYNAESYKKRLETDNEWLEVISYPTNGKDIGTCKCKKCGSLIDKTRDTWLSKRYYVCPYCSDRISYPNKYLKAFLSQLPVIRVKYEYIPEWANRKRYDAYFEYNDRSYVVEMDGRQHYEDTKWATTTYQRKNDAEKDGLAKENGVIPIRIDARYSNSSYIKKSIENSYFDQLFDLDKVNFDECNRESLKSIVINAAELCNTLEIPTAAEIARRLNISESSAKRYLNQATELGMCYYNPKDAYKKWQDKHERKPRVNQDLESFLERNPLVEQVGKYYEKHPEMTNAEIAKVFGLASSTVSRHIRIATKLGKIKYNAEGRYANGGKRGSQGNRIKIIVLDGDNLVGEYLGNNVCVENLAKIYPGKHITLSALKTKRQRVKSKRFEYKGLNFMIEERKMQNG